MTGVDSFKLLRIARLASIAALGIGIAIAMRLRLFLANRSLSQDEAQLALNIIDRPFSGLFGRLDFNQAAPQGFLTMQKLSVGVFGTSESSLRLIPFLAGVLSLVVMLFLARRTVSSLAVPLAVGFLAFSDPAIFYTSHNKQYAVDVLATVLVLLAGLRLCDRRCRASAAVLFAGVGSVVVWVSHSSVFVLAGISSVTIVGSVARRQWRNGACLVTSTAAWLLSFGVWALTSLDTVRGIQGSLGDSGGVFLSSGASGLVDAERIRTGLGAIRFVTGIPIFAEWGPIDAGQVLALLSAGFCVMGYISLVSKSREKALALIAPGVVMLVAWGLGEYPLLGRTQLFLAPIYVLLLSEGIVESSKRARRPGARAACLIAAGAVGIAIAAQTSQHFVHPRDVNEMKPALEYLAREQRPSDTVLVYFGAQPQLRYYLECDCGGPQFEAARIRGLWPLLEGSAGPAGDAPAMRSVPPNLIVPQFRGEDPSNYARAFDKLRGRSRVWVLATEIVNPTREDLVRELDRRGTRRAAFVVGDLQDFATAVVVYLYDMTRPERGMRALPARATGARRPASP